MTVEYEDGKPDHLERVLVSCQYTENKKLEAGDIPKVHFTRVGGKM